MMTKDQPIIFSENVVMVEYHETTSLSCLGVITTIGDPWETIRVEGLQSEAVEETPWAHIKNLFGAWTESGDEDKELDAIYKSRMIASSVPYDQE